MELQERIVDLKNQGFETDYYLKFDALYTEDDQRLEMSQISSIERISFDSSDSSSLCFLYAISCSEESNGIAIIDLKEHTDPISIEVIDQFDLPNLSTY